MEIKKPDNRNVKICRSLSPHQESEGIGVPTVRPFEGYVPAMNNTSQNDLVFLEWAKKVCAESFDTLLYMLESSDELDRAIAKRIIQNAGGNY